MFTGIVKGLEPVEKIIRCQTELKIQVRRPRQSAFSSLEEGDSVSVNGVCLTLEKLSSAKMTFHLGKETLKLTGWTPQILKKYPVNLEPALKIGSSVGGHFVSGHVDGVAEWLNISDLRFSTRRSNSQVMELKVPTRFKNYFWKKAFIAVNGVSLTINQVKKDRIFVCLVPETIRRTNLLNGQSKFATPRLVTFEIDTFTRALMATIKNIKT